MNKRKLGWVGIVASVMLVFGVRQAAAATVVWDGGLGGAGTNWNEAVNWKGDVKPGASDLASFSNNGETGMSTAKTVMLDAPQTAYMLYLPNWANLPSGVTFGSAQDVAAGNTLTVAAVYRWSNAGDNTKVAAPMTANTNVMWVIENGNFYASGNIGGTGGLTKYNGGTLRLQGTNTYTGATVARGGTLMLDYNTSFSPVSDIVNPSSPLRMEGGYLHFYRKAAATRTQSFDTVTAVIGASTARIESNWDAYGRLALGAFDRQTGATLNLRQPSGRTTISANNGFATSQANDATGILGPYLTVSPDNSDTPADWAANNGVNIVAYTGYTTPTGLPAVIADSASSNVQINNASTGDVTLASSAVAVNTLKYADTSARTLDLTDSTLRIGSPLGGILVPGSVGALTIKNGTITSGGVSGEVAFIISSTVTNSAALTDTGNGTVALTKSGSGNLVMTTAPSHSGGTFVNAGGLYLPNVVNPLTPEADLTVNGGTLDFGGATQTNSASVVIRGGTIQNGTIYKTVSDYAAEGGTASSTATLHGNAGLVKTGSSTFSVSKTSYTGTTTVLEGRMDRPSGSTSLKGNLIVGSPGGKFPAAYGTQSSGNGNADNKNVTVYQNGYYYQGDYPGINDLTVYGGDVDGSWYDIGGTIRMTGGALRNGPITGNNYALYTYASSSTAVISAEKRWGLYMGNDPFYSVEDGAAVIDLKVTAGILNETTTRATSKTGAGVMQITSGTTFNEKNFNINAGTVLLDNATGSGSGKATVVVAGGASLGGTGFIGGVAGYAKADVMASGASGNESLIAPGTLDPLTGNHVIGTLTVGNLAIQTNNVTFGAYSKLVINIATNGACDRLVVNGTLSLATATDTLEFTAAGGGTPPAGTYNLVTFQQLAGAGQVFDTVTGLPERCTLVYTPTGIDLIATAVPPQGTIIRIL